MSEGPDEPLNGDLGVRVVLDTNAMPWQASPSAGVDRKRLHRVGPAESGQVTSVVRYAPGSSFPPHDHPEGEEIFVLDGVFSDEHGDWPAGTYLLNPEGFRHAPFSREGCVIFVKLRQAPGAERSHVELQSDELEWAPSAWPGIEYKLLRQQQGFLGSADLERWSAGADPGARVFEGGAELFVVSGVLQDDLGEHAAGRWLRIPVGTSHHAHSSRGCVLFVIRGGVAGLHPGA